MRFAGMALDGGNYVNAAQNNGGAMEAILAKTTPKYGALSNTASAAKSAERVSEMNATAQLQNAAINSLANTKASAFRAEATIAAGEAAASATQSAGIGNMVGGLAGGLGGLFNSRTAKGAEGIGVASTSGFGNYPTYNSKQALSGANAIGLTY